MRARTFMRYHEPNHVDFLGGTETWKDVGTALGA